MKSLLLLMQIIICQFLCINILTVDSQCSEKKESHRSEIFSDPTTIKIDSLESLIHIGSLDSFDLTDEGINTGNMMLKSLENKDEKLAKKVIEEYNKIIPHQYTGAEYTALQWFEMCIFNYPDKTVKYLDNKLYRYYFDFFVQDDYKLLKEYLMRKYKLRKYEVEHSERNDLSRFPFLNDLVCFFNPRRQEWEHTDELNSLITLKEGDKVADVGCGPGLYSYLLSEKVGKTGIIYALDIKRDHLDFIDEFCKKYKVKNIKTIQNGISTLNLPENHLDVVFLCSLYHVIYAECETERMAFINDIKKSLKLSGRLIIVDNNPVENNDIPYYGNYIDKRLIISQLYYFGFKLEKYVQVVPQRYYLEFSMVNKEEMEWEKNIKN